jgi:uncharacterized membrane protein YagU involved in acid resistance
MRKIRDKALRVSDTLANRIGRGLLAGLAGTMAISLSQMIDMKLSKRLPSTTPADAVDKVFGAEQKNQEDTKKLAGIVHWLYGSSWGLVRALLSYLGIRKKAGTLAEFVAITFAAFKMLPSLKVAPPVKEWENKEIIKEVLHHAVYSFVSGVVYDSIAKRKLSV